MMRSLLSIALASLSLFLVDIATGDDHKQEPSLGQPRWDPGQRIGYGKTPLITSNFSAWIEDEIAKASVKGLALTIVRPDGEVEFGAWGNRTEDGDPVTADTLFSIGSCSKAFLATSVGILMDDYANGRNTTPLPSGLSKFDWDTKLKDLLPNEWKLKDKWASEYANVRDILSHVSGLPRHDYSYGVYDVDADVLHRLRYLNPTYELRQHWSYNNQMYMVGAYLVSKLTGAPYPDFARKRIFDPLGFPRDSALFSPSEAEQSGKLSQSWLTNGRRIPFWFNEKAAELGAGPGGIITSVTELAKWLKVLIGEGVDLSTNTTVIPKSVLEAMTWATAMVSGAGAINPNRGVRVSISGYAMGWVRQSYNSYELVQHSGNIPGFVTSIVFLPHESLGIAIVVNTQEQGRLGSDVTLRIIDDALGMKSDVARVVHHEDSPRPRPASSHQGHEPPSIPLDRFAGAYTNAGYGTFTLCSVDSTSHYCERVLSDFATVDKDTRSGSSRNTTQTTTQYRKSSGLQLLGEWARLSSHLRVVHSHRNTFSVLPTTLFPDGYGADTSPFEVSDFGEENEGDDILAEFVVEDDRVVGVGISGPAIEPPDSKRIKTGDVRQDALVWFDRIEA